MFLSTYIYKYPSFFSPFAPAKNTHKLLAIGDGLLIFLAIGRLALGLEEGIDAFVLLEEVGQILCKGGSKEGRGTGVSEK